MRLCCPALQAQPLTAMGGHGEGIDHDWKPLRRKMEPANGHTVLSLPSSFIPRLSFISRKPDGMR
jgi:hypothetical protein